MDIKVLLCGRMTTKELAEWFGIAYSTFRKSSKEKYEELNQYCEYSKEYGYIEIKKVYKKIYIKNPSQFQIIKKYTQIYWLPEVPETAIRIATIIKKYHSDEVTVVLNTCASYVAAAKNELWPDEGRYGERGGSYREWVKTYRDKEGNRIYEAFSPQEKEIRSNIRRKYIPELSDDEKDLLYSDYLDGLLSEEEYISKFNGGHMSKVKFLQYQKEVAEALGCDYLTKATYVKDGVYFVIEIDSNGIPTRREIQVKLPEGAF